MTYIPTNREMLSLSIAFLFPYTLAITVGVDLSYSIAFGLLAVLIVLILLLIHSVSVSREVRRLDERVTEHDCGMFDFEEDLRDVAGARTPMNELARDRHPAYRARRIQDHENRGGHNV